MNIITIDMVPEPLSPPKFEACTNCYANDNGSEFKTEMVPVVQ